MPSPDAPPMNLPPGHPPPEPAGERMPDVVGQPRVAPAPRVTRSETLLGGARELQIEHRGSIYRLRQTAQGKLILTK